MVLPLSATGVYHVGTASNPGQYNLTPSSALFTLSQGNPVHSDRPGWKRSGSCRCADPA